MNQEEINTLRETVISVLKKIYDPEIPIDIWTLHLIYGVDVDAEGNVKIVMTVTAPNCPVAETLPAEVQIKVQAIMGVKSVDVEHILCLGAVGGRHGHQYLDVERLGQHLLVLLFARLQAPEQIKQCRNDHVGGEKRHRYAQSGHRAERETLHCNVNAQKQQTT